MDKKNIFISFKFNDRSVGPSDTVRKVTSTVNYVRYLKAVLDNSYDFNYSGEYPDNDLSHLSDEVIWQHLKDKIFSTSLTIVLISPDMVDPSRKERDQWVPREIRYSLYDKFRSVGPSYSNAMLAIVLPDCHGSYDYAFCRSRFGYRVRTENLFRILSENMYNRIDLRSRIWQKSMSQYGYDSYIPVQRWDDFIHMYEASIGLAYSLRSRIGEYRLCTTFSSD